MTLPKKPESRDAPILRPDAGDWSDDLQPLRDRLAALGQAERTAAPPPELEAAVMRAWDLHDRPRRSRVVRWFGAAAAAAALVVLAYTARNEPATVMQDPPTHAGTAAVTQPAAPAIADVVLVGAPPMPGERIQVVRTRIARDVLTTLGVRPVTSDGEMVDIDLLIGEDGVARGLRLGTVLR